MKIRNKITIMICLVWIALIVGMYLGSELIIKKSFLRLEEESTLNNVQRINEAIQQMEDSVANALGSWAIWDDTYHFMTNKNQNYINSNLKISSFTSSDVDMVLYFDTMGKLFYSISADSARKKAVPLPVGLDKYLLPNGKIVYQPQVNSSTEGIISIPSGILMFASHSIVTSNNIGPVHGTLMMAKYFTEKTLKKLIDITKLNMSIVRVGDLKPGSDFYQTYQHLGSVSHLVNRPDDNTLIVYAGLKDIDGNIVAIIKGVWPRSIYQVGLKTINFYNFIVIASSLLLVLILWLSIHSFVVRRLEKLRSNIINVKQNQDLLLAVGKKSVDEVSSVAFLYHHATHDPLTGLGNRNLIHQAFENRKDTLRDNHKIVLIFIDVDHFKYVNDILGHEIGDKLLIHISRQLSSSLRSGDIAVRMGGDEFVVMLFDLPIETIHHIVNRLVNTLRRDVVIDGHELHVTCSMGISLYPDNGNDIHLLLKHADIALYHAKESGRNQFQFYSKYLSKLIQDATKKELELQHAIDNKELCLFYQPIYDPFTKEILNVEALLRWNHPEKGLISAGEFITIAEKSGLIIPIGKWVLKTACAQIKTWQDQGLPVTPVAVNLSLLQIKNFSVNRLVSEILLETNLAPNLLELELTETSYVEINDVILKELHLLKDRGIKLAVDDFGVGYSGLGYLKSLPINKLKIDQSFIRDIFKDPDDRAIVLAIIAIAHQLNLQVVAEGVETKAQFDFLKEHYVDGVQGRYLSSPLSVADCEKLIKSKTIIPA